jgi:Leucine-rich repeat (LRR) protein
LVTLGLDANDFEGDLENLQYLTNLKRLYLDLNKFEAPLVGNPVLKMRNLQELDLSDNKFSGTIPLDFFQYENLEVLDLNSNFLTGSLPIGSYETSKSLKFLSLQFNQLQGTILDEIVNLKSLAHLDLSLNHFTGTIPNILGKMTNLKYLFLADNPFQASSVPNLSMLTNLEDLSLKKTNLTNEIPAFTKLTKLVLLDLDNNNLSGEIPIELSELTSLKYLYLSRNENIIGTVPTEIQLLPKLSKSWRMTVNNPIICAWASSSLYYLLSLTK